LLLPEELRRRPFATGELWLGDRDEGMMGVKKRWKIGWGRLAAYGNK
jgi:hypothetical protein